MDPGCELGASSSRDDKDLQKKKKKKRDFCQKPHLKLSFVSSSQDVCPDRLSSKSLKLDAGWLLGGWLAWGGLTAGCLAGCLPAGNL